MVPNRHRLSQDGTAASGGDEKMPVWWKIDGGGGRFFCIGGGGVGARYPDDEVDLDARNFADGDAAVCGMSPAGRRGAVFATDVCGGEAVGGGDQGRSPAATDAAMAGGEGIWRVFERYFIAAGGD